MNDSYARIVCSPVAHRLVGTANSRRASPCSATNCTACNRRFASSTERPTEGLLTVMCSTTPYSAPRTSCVCWRRMTNVYFSPNGCTSEVWDQTCHLVASLFSTRWLCNSSQIFQSTGTLMWTMTYSSRVSSITASIRGTRLARTSGLIRNSPRRAMPASFSSTPYFAASSYRIMQYMSFHAPHTALMPSKLPNAGKSTFNHINFSSHGLRGSY